MKQYRLITNPPYDKGAPVSYWIECIESTFFELFKKRSVIGDYSIDETYGVLGQMPFFSKSAAKQRIKQLK